MIQIVLGINWNVVLQDIDGILQEIMMPSVAAAAAAASFYYLSLLPSLCAFGTLWEDEHKTLKTKIITLYFNLNVCSADRLFGMDLDHHKWNTVAHCRR